MNTKDKEKYNYPDTYTPLADAKDKSILFEYYTNADTAYVLEIYPDKKVSRLSYDGRLIDDIWYYRDADTYIPLDIEDNEKSTRKNINPTPVKVRWLRHDSIMNYENLIRRIEQDSREADHLWLWIQATISAVDWSFENDIGRWKTSDREFINA